MSRAEAKRRRSCYRKLRHRSAVEASIEAERIYQLTGQWRKPYGCQVCGGFHLTSCRALSQAGRAT